MKIEELINGQYNNLNSNDMIIGRYITRHKMECSEINIEELAKRCNVSRTTVMRFSQKLGLSGFSELKTILKWEIKNYTVTTDNCMENVCSSYTKAIADMADRNFDDICEKIYNAKRVLVYGSGAIQSSVAREITRIFLNGGYYFYNLEGQGETEVLLNAINPGDVMILISLSGESSHIINFAKKLKMKNVTIISITKLKSNTLANISDKNIYVSTSTVFLNNNFEYESINLYFIVVELLFLKFILYCNTLKIDS